MSAARPASARWRRILAPLTGAAAAPGARPPRRAARVRRDDAPAGATAAVEPAATFPITRSLAAAQLWLARQPTEHRGASASRAAPPRRCRQRD